MDRLPFESSAIARFPTLSSWQAEAPGVVASMLGRWNLTAGEAFVGGVSGAVLAVTRADGSPAVLKVGFPHVESIWEAVGLRALATSGLAPAVLEQDVWTWSMLLEPVVPGTPLSKANLSPDDALGIGGEVLARVHGVSAPTGTPFLETAMRDYLATATSGLSEQGSALDDLGVGGLVPRGLALLPLLASADGQSAPTESRLLHGDFNPGNVLLGETGGNVVDPNPLVGDPAYDVWPLVSQLGHPAESSDLPGLLAHQLAVVCSASGVDPRRAALWGFARSALDVTWCIDDGASLAAKVAARQLDAWASVAGQ